jgi:hypothetical protein
MTLPLQRTQDDTKICEDEKFPVKNRILSVNSIGDNHIPRLSELDSQKTKSRNTLKHAHIHV